MHRSLELLKFVLLNLLALAAAVLLWSHALAGIFAFVISGMKFRRWVSSIVALALVVAWRMMSGNWKLSLGDSPPEQWYLELLPGILNWAIASLFVSAFAQWPAAFLEGYHSKLSSEPKAVH